MARQDDESRPIPKVMIASACAGVPMMFCNNLRREFHDPTFSAPRVAATVTMDMARKSNEFMAVPVMMVASVPADVDRGTSMPSRYGNPMRTVPIVTAARMMIVIVQHNHTRAGPIMVVAVSAAYVVDLSVAE